MLFQAHNLFPCPSNVLGAAGVKLGYYNNWVIFFYLLNFIYFICESRYKITSGTSFHTCLNYWRLRFCCFLCLGIFYGLKVLCPRKNLRENDNSCFFLLLKILGILGPWEDLFLQIPGFGQVFAQSGVRWGWESPSGSFWDWEFLGQVEVELQVLENDKSKCLISLT